MSLFLGARKSENKIQPVSTISTMDSATGINIRASLLHFTGILEQGNNPFSSQMPNWDCHRFTERVKFFDFQLKDHFGNSQCGLKF